MNLDLAGKTALVTASTAGIGYAIAEGLAKEGAVVWVNGRTQARVDAALDKIKSAVPKAQVKGVAGDLATAEGARAVIAALPAVDVLVNNLGGLGGIMKPFDKLEDGDWHTIFEVNVVSAVRMTQHYLPKMREKNWGRIVYISSEIRGADSARNGAVWRRQGRRDRVGARRRGDAGRHRRDGELGAARPDAERSVR